MDVDPRRACALDLALEDGTKIPLDSPMYVHNLSAVGEQYLDFEPPDDKGPYAEAGDTIKGSAESLPVDEDDLLVELNQFVELGRQENLRSRSSASSAPMFRDTGGPAAAAARLRRHVRRRGRRPTSDETIALLDNGLTVLQHPARRRREHPLVRPATCADSPARCGTATTTCARVLQGTPAHGPRGRLRCSRTSSRPCRSCSATWSASTRSWSRTSPALEQLLVTFPRIISSGFTGTPGDGYGHVNLQFNNKVQPCTKGYMPRSQWRRGDQT